MIEFTDALQICTVKKYGSSFEQNRPNGYDIGARMALGRKYQKGFPEALMGYEER